METTIELTPKNTAALANRTVRFNNSVLAFFQHAGLQLYMPGFIDAVNVAD